MIVFISDSAFVFGDVVAAVPLCFSNPLALCLQHMHTPLTLLESRRGRAVVKYAWC